jgi:relaxase-like protein
MIMIHSIRKGAGFGGVLKYVSDPNKGYLLGGSYAPETSAREIAADMGRHGHERSSKPVFHASLNLPPGERLNEAQWLRAASQYLEGLGYSDVPFVVYRHTDREHDHIPSSPPGSPTAASWSPTPTIALAG